MAATEHLRSVPRRVEVGSLVAAEVTRPSRRAAFTLVELLVVIALITIFAGVIGFALFGGGGSTVGLQSSQSIIVGLLTQARSQAAITGRNARLYVHTDIDPNRHSDRFLRYLIVCVRSPDGLDWEPVSGGVFLPNGCAIVPDPAPNTPLVDTPDEWTGLRSTALNSEPAGVLRAFDSSVGQTWSYVELTPQGKVFGGGSLVVANCEARVPADDEPPLKLVNPLNVRGVVITIYGQTRLAPNSSALPSP